MRVHKSWHDQTLKQQVVQVLHYRYVVLKSLNISSRWSFLIHLKCKGEQISPLNIRHKDKQTENEGEIAQFIQCLITPIMAKQ